MKKGKTPQTGHESTSSKTENKNTIGFGARLIEALNILSTVIAFDTPVGLCFVIISLFIFLVVVKRMFSPKKVREKNI